MAKGKSYQRYSASFKRMALTKAAEDGVTDAFSGLVISQTFLSEIAEILRLGIDLSRW
jgi:hypothetical protein